MKPLLLALSLLLAVPLAACQPGDAAESARAPASHSAPEAARETAPATPYRFDQPAARFSLPPDLREISALTVLDDGHLGAVQDEAGSLYVLDAATGQIDAVVPFGPPGDYEGVELAAGRLFALRSDGALLELGGWDGGAVSLRTHPTGLGSKCDAEGLGYDAERERLLIACKEDGGKGLGKKKAIYGFDLASETLSPEPAFVIDPDALPDSAGGKAHKMKPSALAVHPVTGAIFVISSKHDVLLALRPDGTVAEAWNLSEAGFEQPEGLAFFPNGDLFIASEGDDEPPVLARFAYATR